jgi:uncharacterized membrane protein
MGRKVDRFWEVDAARGIAIIMMIVYHCTYDLDTLGGYRIQSTTGYLALFADVTASLFLFLVGISLAISRTRTSLTGWRLFGKYLARGSRILAYGVVLTVVFLALGMGVVAFGILHLIGISIILAYPFLRLRITNLVLGTVIFVTGQYILAQDLYSQSFWLLPFGVVPEGVVMPDYRPLVPAELAGQRVIRAPGLPWYGSRRGRRSSNHSAGTSRLRAVVRAVTNPGGDAGDKAPFEPGDRARCSVSLLCPP